MSDLESTKKSVSEIIQIDAIVAKVHEVSNQETRKAEVQLNIVEDDENVTSEPCCAPTKSPVLCVKQHILGWIGLLFNLIAFIFFTVVLITVICFWFVCAHASGFVLMYIAVIFCSFLVSFGVVYFAMILVVIPWGKFFKDCHRSSSCTKSDNPC